MTQLFSCNGNYKDLAQVEPYYSAYLQVRERAIADHGYAYNADFVDQIPGLANKAATGRNQGSHEEAGIYLLQQLHGDKEQARRIQSALAAGYRRLTTLPATQKFPSLIVCTEGQGGLAGHIWRELQRARVIPDAETHEPSVVLPANSRSKGYDARGRLVLVR